MTDLFGNPPPKILQNGKPSKKGSNPLIHFFGKGPADMKCWQCVNHVIVSGGSRNYGKCKIRGYSGAKTDHSSYLPTCGKFTPQTP